MNIPAWVNGTLASTLYFVPLTLCVYGYTVRTWRNYRKDIARRQLVAEAKANDPKAFLGYMPTDTVGTLIGRAVVTVIPIANLWAACFDIGPWLFGRFIDKLSAIFNQPIVPERKP